MEAPWWERLTAGETGSCSEGTIAFISHTGKVMLKILQARLQKYVNCELPDVQVGLGMAEEPEIKLPTSVGSSKKQESSRKTPTSALLTTSKHLTVWIKTNCGKFWKRWEYQSTLPASWEICIQVKEQQLEPDMEQQTGSKPGKEYIKAVYCHPAYLTYMQRTSCEMPGWMKHKLESRLLNMVGRNINNLRYANDTTLMEEREKQKSLLMKSERGEWKSWLKTQHSEN